MLQDIFKAILVTSFIGTALTLVLTLIKPITKRWFTSSWHYYMWLVVLVVMLLPIRISLPNNSHPVPALEINSQISDKKESGDAYEPIQVTKQDLELNSDKEGNTYNRIENLKIFAYDKLNIVSFVWFVIMIALFFSKLIGYMIFLIKLRKYSDIISCPELMRFTNKKIVARTSDRISSPLMIGLFKPTLLLPETEMTPEQLDNVLAHEMTHFRRKDILYKWFIRIIIKLALDDAIDNYEELVQKRKIAVYGSEIKTLNYCYAIEIGKTEYIINPEDAFPFKSEIFKTHFNTKENMKNAPILKGSTTYVPYEYIDKFLDHHMNGVGPFGVDGPYNITCTVDSENPVAYVTPCFFWPAENDIDNSVSKSFGVIVHPLTGEKLVHNGIDTIAKENSNVFSAIRGKVTEVGFDDELGNYVVVANDSGVSTLYGHLSSVDVKEGDYLHKRANIGKVGKSGTATGAFLHFEIKINGVYYDPMKFWVVNPINDIEVINNEEFLSQADTQNDNSEFEWNNSTQTNADSGSSGNSRATLSILTQNDTRIKIKSTEVGNEPYTGFEHLVLKNADTNKIKQELNKQGIVETKKSSVDLTKNYVVKDYSSEQTKVESDKNGNISLYFSVNSDNLFDVRFYDAETGEDVGSYGVLANNENAYTFIGFEKGKTYNVEVQGQTKDDWAIEGNYIIY